MIALSIVCTLLGVFVGMVAFSLASAAVSAGRARRNADPGRPASAIVQLGSVAVPATLLVALCIVAYFVIGSSRLDPFDLGADRIGWVTSNNAFASFCLGMVLGIVLWIWLVAPQAKSGGLLSVASPDLRLGSISVFLAVLAIFFVPISKLFYSIQQFESAGISITLRDKNISPIGESYYISSGDSSISDPAFPELLNKSKEFMTYLENIDKNISDDEKFVRHLSQQGRGGDSIGPYFNTKIRDSIKCARRIIDKFLDPERLYQLSYDIDVLIENTIINNTSISQDGHVRDMLFRADRCGAVPASQGNAGAPADDAARTTFWNETPYGIMVAALLLGGAGAYEPAALALTEWLRNYYKPDGSGRLSVDENGDVTIDSEGSQTKLHAWLIVRALVYLEIIMGKLDKPRETFNVVGENLSLMDELFLKVSRHHNDVLNDVEFTSSCLRYDSQEAKRLMLAYISRKHALHKLAIKLDSITQDMLRDAKRYADISDDCLRSVDAIDGDAMLYDFLYDFKQVYAEMRIYYADDMLRENGRISESIEKQYASADEYLIEAKQYLIKMMEITDAAKHTIAAACDQPENSKPAARQEACPNGFLNILSRGRDDGGLSRINRMREYIRSRINQ